MASKSKKRRRVLGASCILAALIIAGSSFAWFTSKDEVTNRLSASGDYDVSIVESFAPPAKWVPGQAVNKDVYAVNTGNVEAFVKESVSSVLTVVTEDAYTTDDSKPDADSIKLTPAERYVVEAGAFLAYAPAASKYTYDDGENVGQVKSGMKVIAMSPEPRQTEDNYTSTAATDFTPDVEGLYVFRRTIGVDPTTQLENYTYDAYYYVPGTGSSVKETQKTKNSVTVYNKDANNTGNGPDTIATDAATAPTGYTASGTTADNVPVYKVGDVEVATDYPEGLGTLGTDYTPVYGVKVQAKNDSGVLAWVNKDDPADVQYNATNPDPTKYVEKYVEVAGVDGVFYKVSNLAVTPEKATFAGDLDQRDGMVEAGWTYNEGTQTSALDDTAAPKYGFYKDVTKTVVPKLTYDKLNNRLVATYNTGVTSTNDQLKALAKAYEDAAIAYQDALETYAAALGDQDNTRSTLNTDKDLADATKALRKAVDDLLKAQYAEEAAQDAYDKAEAKKDELYAKMQAALAEKNAAANALGEEEDSSNNPIVYDPDTGDNDTLWGRYNYYKQQLGESTNNTNATAWGRENVAAGERDSKRTIYEQKKTAREQATQGERDAFLDLVVAKSGQPIGSGDDAFTVETFDGVTPAEKRTQAENWLKNLTYKQMEDLSIENLAVTNPAAYSYYTKLIEEKGAKEDLEEAQAALDQARRKREEAQRDFDLAKEAREAAENALGSGTGTDTTTATGRYNKAKEEYEAKVAELYGTGTDYDSATDGSLAYTLRTKKAATDAAQAEKDTKQSLFDDALAASNVAAENVKNAAEEVAKKRAARDNAWTAYETAYNQTTGELKININLADVVTEGGVADKWQLLPESLEDKYNNGSTLEYTEDTPAVQIDGITDTASFYYTSILGGGETSAKLIDSVELDPSVTKEMFKYFDFDLNITLNSAQVNIDENGNYTAETAQSELGKYAILSDNTSADTAITWSDTSTIPEAAKAKTYRGTFTDAVTPNANTYANQTITELAVPQTFDYVDYKYVVTIGGDTYYGTSKDAASAKFYKYNPATGTLLKNTDTVKTNELTLDAAAAEITHTKKVTFKNATTPTEPDIVADYVYAGTTWTGATPTGTNKYCATNSSTESDWSTSLSLTTDDEDQTFYYKTT